MNTTLLLAELRDLLNDEKGLSFSDEMLIRAANRQMRGLFRTMIQGNKEYSNYTIGMTAGGNALEVYNNTWEFRLPSWITQVTDVYRAEGFSVVEPYWASYKWTNGSNVNAGQVIPKWTTNQQYPHWLWQGNNNTLRLVNYSVCPDILLCVAVRPPLLFRAKIATVNASPSGAYLPPIPEFGGYENEEGALINGVVEVVSTQNVNSTNYGMVRRVVYSSANTLVSGSRTYIIEIDKRWDTALAAGDVIESVIPIPDQHTRILVLKTAQAAFQRKNNVEGLRSIGAELGEELVKFTSYAASPRDRNGPTFIKRTLSNRAPYGNGFMAYGWGW